MLKKLTLAIPILSLSIVFFTSSSYPVKTEEVPEMVTSATPKIQAAILLDVSGSMQGLIEQAKAQLWNMVTVMGKAQCNGVNPQIEIALYEYGRTSVSRGGPGYVLQISPFTTDLDQLSKELFKLSTDGGDEYCGQVMYTSLNDLKWDSSSSSYKVIFIAGNEDFLQGDVHYTKACALAKKKGVVINTIYCGDKMQGVREHWNLNMECGQGSYTHIDHHSKPVDIPTPYDTVLFTLNNQLNKTYIGYGDLAVTGYNKQVQADQQNRALTQKAMAERVAVKGKGNLYRNSSWDLVDAYTDDKTIIAKVDMKTLPENLRNKTRSELEQIVKDNQATRAGIQKQIEETSKKREDYMAAERAKNASTNQTLETQIEKIIKEQAKERNMIIQ